MYLDDMPGVCTGIVLTGLWGDETEGTTDEFGGPSDAITQANLRDAMTYKNRGITVAVVIPSKQQAAYKLLTNRRSGFKCIGSYAGSDGHAVMFVKGLRLPKEGRNTKTRKRR